MTNDDLNARAAEIMGFDGNHRNFGDMWYVPPDDSAWRAFLKKDWNPCENIAQAMLLFHKFGGMDILTSGDGKTFQARERYTAHCRANWCSSNERTVELAIVYAAIAAAAWSKK